MDASLQPKPEVCVTWMELSGVSHDLCQPMSLQVFRGLKHEGQMLCRKAVKPNTDLKSTEIMTLTRDVHSAHQDESMSFPARSMMFVVINEPLFQLRSFAAFHLMSSNENSGSQ